MAKPQWKRNHLHIALQWVSLRKGEWASEKAMADARKGGTDPLVGAELLSDILPRSEGHWKTRLFVPDLNKSSKAELRLLGFDQLKVTGCVVGRLGCKSQVWTRAVSE